jgi:hypothetical protein
MDNDNAKQWTSPKPSRQERVSAIRKVTARVEKICPHRPCKTCTTPTLCPLDRLAFWPDIVSRA